MKRRYVVAVSFALVLLTNPSDAQKVNSSPLKWNSYRDIGGSCVYGANGELVYAPAGRACRDRRQHLGNTPVTPESQLVDMPPALRGEAEALMGDHAHIATEFVELRQLIAVADKVGAIAKADEVIAELTKHQAREEKFFRSISSKKPTQSRPTTSK